MSPYSGSALFTSPDVAVNGQLCWELPDGEIAFEDPEAEDSATEGA